MINCERWVLRAAVLTSHAVSAKYILAREFNLSEWHAEIGAQSNHRRKGVIAANRSNHLGCVLLDHLCLCKEEQHERFFCAAHADGLVRLIKNQHLRIERRNRSGLRWTT